MEGVFSVKITPLGANLCLLEDLEEAFLVDMLDDGCTWWKRWFNLIRPWQKKMLIMIE